MMKREKRFCRVARSHPLSDLQAIEDDLLRDEVHEDQRTLLKRMHKVHRTKAYVHFLWIVLAVVASLGLSGQQELQAQPAGNPFAAPYLNLDPAMIPSGLLHNRSPWYYDAFEYDTLSNTLQLNYDWLYSPYLFNTGYLEAPSHVFMHLYKEMLFAQIHDSVIINPVDYKAAWDQAAAIYDVPISLMLLNFHNLPDDALMAGKVHFDTVLGTFGPFPDTLWLPDTMHLPDTIFYADTAYYLTFQNPDSLLESAFQQFSLAASMIKEEVFYIEDTVLTLEFGVPENLAIQNLDTLPQIYIDFDDGAGLQEVQWGVGKLIVYNLPSQPRIQEIQLKISIPAFLPDLFLIEKILVTVNSVLPDTVVFTDDLPPGCEILEGSTAATGKLSVRFADPNTPELKKPVLFVEGFETAPNPYGVISFMNIMNDLMPILGFPEIQEMPLLFDSLKILGYDLVYLDFADSRDSLERIALTVARAIQWINSELVANQSSEKLVVASASMGGLTTRYALRLMELNNCCHNTRLWISFDAPHRGANIPVGIQYMVEHAAETSKNWKGLSWPLSWIDNILELGLDLNVPSVESLNDMVLNSPAARTMLIQHIDPTATANHQQFYAMLDELGYPEYCRKISLINGSENGVKLQLDDPHGRILETGKISKLPWAWVPLFPGTNLTGYAAYFPLLFEEFRIAYSLVLHEEEPMVFVRNDWGESVEALNKILFSSVFHSGLNGVFGVAGLTAAATLNLPLAAFMDGCMIGNKLLGNHRLSGYHNMAPLITVPSAGLLPLTTAPGGLNDALKKLGDSFDGKVEAYSDKFSFIPSTSALDVKGVALDEDLSHLYLNQGFCISPFDAYWAPSRIDGGAISDENEMHVEVSFDNRHWIIDHVLHDWALRPTNIGYYGVLSGIYNYGRPSVHTDIIYVNQPYQKILYSLDVMAGGELLVNAQMDIGLPGSYLLPKPMGHFKLVSNGDACDPAVVKVMQNGSLVLGDPLNYNTAELFMSPNSSLELLPGSSLKLHGASSLVIGEGAILIVHPGAVIELHHTDAVLEIQGKLVLPDGSALSVTGPGYVRYNTAMTPANYKDYFSLGQQTAIRMAGTGTDDRKLMIATDTWFPIELTLEVFNAAVTLEEDAFLATAGPVVFNQTHVRADDTTKRYGGVVLYGQKSVSLNHTTFSHAHTALKANLAIGGNPLQLNGCLFRNNHTGLYCSDERVRLVDCVFRDNQLGWHAENMAGVSLIERTLFKGNTLAGVQFGGQISSGLLFRESDLEQNYNGVQVSDGILQATCSRFVNNTYAGIMAENNARILLGDGSKNQLTGNFIGIALNKALELDILNGHLKFSGNNYYVIGELLPNIYFDLSSNTLNSLDFSGNHMPYQTNGLPVNPYIYHPVSAQVTPFNVVCHTMVPEGWTQCSNTTPVQNEHLLHPITLIAGASVIQGGMFHNHLLTDALLQAANHVSCDDYAGNDTLAIAAFHQILSHLPAQLSDAERGGVDYALELMTLALGNAIDKEMIDPNRGLDGTPVDVYVEMIAMQVQEQLDNLDGQAAFAAESEARYALLKAQMYRVAEHYDYALEILDEFSLFSGTSIVNDAVYWGCVCATERLLLLDSIDRTAFHLKMDSCSLALITARMLPYMPHFGVIPVADLVGPDDWVKQVYPNPANRRIVVELAASTAGIETELQDARGRVVLAARQPWSTDRVNIDLPDLPPGIYVLKISTMDKVSHHKVMVRQQQ